MIHTSSSAGLIILFTLSQLALTSGPNITTFLNPVELFPTRVRGSAHGISAASGKCGAVLTAFAFGSVVDSIGLRGALGLFSGIMFLVALVTLWIPETKGMSLEEIEGGALYGDSIESGLEVVGPIVPVDEKDAEGGVKTKSVSSIL